MSWRLKDLFAWTAARQGMPWARDVTDPITQLSHDEGVRLRRGSTTPPDGPRTFGEAFGAHFDPDTGWGMTNRILVPVGAMAGLGFGLWKALFSGAALDLGAAALTIAQWTLAGAAGGALFLMGLVAAASIGLLVGILFLLGLLLEVLAG
jgi:hypothetical protein